MARSPKRPVVSRTGDLSRTQEELEDVARGPKSVLGRKSWRTQEQADGSLGVNVVRVGRYEAALFDPTRGEWFS